MHTIIARLWKDDNGALISMEYLFVATILIIGLVVGLTALREAIISECTELGNAILALSQTYTVSGSTGDGGSVEGSATWDTPGMLTDPFMVPPASSPIDVLPGN